MAELMSAELFALGLRLDPVTFDHCVRVGMHARDMARAVGMSDAEERLFTVACCFHDIGKLLIPHELLAKRLPLDVDEMALIREHPVLGVEMLRSLLGWRDPDMLAIVRSHHERWDGRGYPDGLRGTAIPEWARMCAVMDAYDAMTRHRSYNRVKTDAEAREELRSQRGIQFDGVYVDLFLETSTSSVVMI
ncbi:HD domain-containing protein [Paenibacillus sp. LHD-117]|uniref:HD-GYP domain-containing protein n=1 Tax=Paenibacillus sp. LHD-117 TaxID=3071412 RepID=UPI0027E1AE02|nr:HD domain-containing phosphohydrolase [Paenibacillus sp. LHD-117]MDQ6419324.1 HD domain-containing protein [Paenibacillus sp. LHD-117]